MRSYWKSEATAIGNSGDSCLLVGSVSEKLILPGEISWSTAIYSVC